MSAAVATRVIGAPITSSCSPASAGTNIARLRGAAACADPGVEVSVNELYTSMAAAAGVTEPAVIAPARAGELNRIALSAAKAKIHLGWESWTTLDEGTKAVIDWTRETSS